MSGFETVKERSKNLLIYGGITAMTGAAMLGVGGAVVAQDASTPTAGTEETTEVTDRRAARQAEYDAFLDALAANLGVADGETVDAAIRTTLKQTIDERLAAGEISANLAADLKAAIDSGEYPIRLRLPGLGGFGDRDVRGHGDVRGVDRDDDVEGVEDATDDTLTPDPATPTAGGEATA